MFQPIYIYGCLYKDKLSLSPIYNAIDPPDAINEYHLVHEWPELIVKGDQAYGPGRIRATIKTISTKQEGV